MKKLMLLLAALLALGAIFALAEEAEPTVHKSGDWQYVLLEDGTVEIYRYAGRDKELTIPETIDGYAVTAIGFEAFSKRPSLTSVTIPDTVTIIGANPFAGGNKLTDIIVSPDHPTLATIDGVLFDKVEKKLICYPYAFTDTSYVIPQGIRIIGDYAFYRCTSLKSVTLPDSVTLIGDYAFSYCHSLESVTLPDSVTTIGDYTFYDCWALREVTLPDSVTTIGNYAFTGSGLTSIEIPDSVTTIVGNPFALCNSLMDIVVSPDNPMLAAIDGVLFDKAEKKLICYPAACKRDSYAIPQGIRSIGDYAFSVCHSLTCITIPDSVTSVGDSVFYGCDSLTSVTIPDSVTSMGDYVFYCCTSLMSVTLPASVTAIGNETFESCTSLESVTIPGSVITIGDYAFNSCHSLTSVTIPDSVTTVGNAAFRSCFSLANIALPNSITTIGNEAFAECHSLTSVAIPDSVTTIGETAFYDCFALTNVTLPASVMAIGNDVFGVDPDCADLDSPTTFTVPRNSWAAQWCKTNGLRYTYPDANDWLLN